MEISKICPVILCGGGGTRLWPLSRKTCPKPFLPLLGEETLFEQAVARVSDGDQFAPVTIVAGNEHTDLIEEQLPKYLDATIIVEPSGRNTAPAIGLAAARLPPEAIMLVCPSDHHIADPKAFLSAALSAAGMARDNYLVSFGIEPTSPEIGYGYLERGQPLLFGHDVARFVEKPTHDLAQEYLESGRYSWNGGIFAFRAGQLLEELAEYRPQMAKCLYRAVERGREENRQFFPDSGAFNQIEAESIDYAVMENTSRAAMVPVNMGWSDIGSWAALSDAVADQADQSGNIARGAAADFEGCKSVFVLSDGPRVSSVGLEDVCIVVSGDEVLVTSRKGAQMVGRLPGAADQ